MARTQDKDSLVIGGVTYGIRELCAHIATRTGAKKQVRYVPVRNTGMFKAGNRTVATYDGKRITDATTKKTIEPPVQKSGALANSGQYGDAGRRSRNASDSDLIGTGNALMMRGKYEQALDSFIVPAHNGNVMGICGKARALAKLGRHEEASYAIDECMNIHPDMPVVLATKMEVLAYAKKFEEIIEMATRRLGTKPHDWDMTSAKFKALHALKRYEEMIEYADWCLARSDEAVEKLREYVGQEFSRKARVTQDMISELDNDVPGVGILNEMLKDYRGETYKTTMYTHKINALNNLDRQEEALHIIDGLVSDPNGVDPHDMRLLKMETLYNLGRYQGLLDYHDLVLGDYSGRFYNTYRGPSLVRLGRYEEAVREYEQALKEGHDYVLGEIALSFAMLSRFSEAEKYADLAMESDSRDLWAIIALSLAMQSNTGSDQARRLAVDIMKARPSGEEVDNLINDFLDKYMPRYVRAIYFGDRGGKR